VDRREETSAAVGYYWQFRKISQDFLHPALQTSKERRGIRPCFAKLQNPASPKSGHP
jgi:hypothetical protein